MNEKKTVPSDFDESLTTPRTNAEIKDEISALDAEMQSLELELKREQVSEIKRKRANRLMELNTRINASKQEIAQREFLKSNCTHKKGGRGHGAVLGGMGTDSNYAVIHHILPSGRHMILCQRCGDEQYGPDPLTGEKATAKYQEFRRFQTDNTASGSTLFLPVHYNREAVQQ
jgi:hypothetical protein